MQRPAQEICAFPLGNLSGRSTNGSATGSAVAPRPIHPLLCSTEFQALSGRKVQK
jgi:hypothetical protein